VDKIRYVISLNCSPQKEAEAKEDILRDLHATT
jgi:hypothetical protein